MHARGSVAIRRDLGDEQQLRAHAAHRSRADQRTETGARIGPMPAATVRVGERERGDGPRRDRLARGNAIGDELAAHEATHRARTVRERRVRSFFGRGGAVARGVTDHGSDELSDQDTLVVAVHAAPQRVASLAERTRSSRAAAVTSGPSPAITA